MTEVTSFSGSAFNFILFSQTSSVFTWAHSVVTSDKKRSLSSPHSQRGGHKHCLAGKDHLLFDCIRTFCSVLSTHLLGGTLPQSSKEKTNPQ